MKKQSYLLLLLMAISTFTYSQQQTFKIDYGFYISDEIKNIDLDNEKDEAKKEVALMALLATMFQEEGVPIAEIWTNQDQLRVDSHGPLQETVQITNKGTAESFMLDPKREQYMISPSVSDKIMDLGDEIALVSEMPVSFVDGQTKTIAGFDCKLAQITVEGEEQNPVQIDIWYSEAIPPAYWGEYPYLEKLPGAALEISTFGLGIKATAVSALANDPTIFQIPEDYTLVDVFSSEYSDTESDDLGYDRFRYTDEDSYLSGVTDGAGNVLTEAIYMSINPFQGNQAVATNEDYQYGTIDVDGKEVIPFEYDYLQYNENENNFCFQIDGLYGLLDNTGKVILPHQYEYLAPFSNGYAVFTRESKNGLIDNKGREVVPAEFDFIMENSDRHFITVNEAMEYKLYSIATKNPTSESYEMISLSGEPNLYLAFKNDRYGYINEEGKTIIPFKYMSASTFDDGIAGVIEADTEEQYWINPKGEKVNE
jgi:GLPGLI family protein